MSSAAYSPAVQRCLLVIQTGVGITHLITSLMRLFLAHHACASFVTAPTRITLLVLGQTALGLATACATNVVLSVRVSVQRRTNQQLVRATIGALVLGCPPLGNSRTRSYHAIGRYSLHMRPACACDRHMCACV